MSIRSFSMSSALFLGSLSFASLNGFAAAGGTFNPEAKSCCCADHQDRCEGGKCTAEQCKEKGCCGEGCKMEGCCDNAAADGNQCSDEACGCCEGGATA